jgi:hypothetical protein
MSITTGVYILYNSSSGTVLDLSNGQVANGTHCQGWDAAPNIDIYNQSWLFKPVVGQANTFTLCNLRSGTFLDLSNGSSDNGTQVQGWSTAVPGYEGDQQWVVSAEGSYYRLQNKKGGTFLELSNGARPNGTKAQAWARADVPAQRWTLKRISRTGAEINALIRANPYIGPKFESYLSDGLYIVPPQSVRNDIYNGTELKTTPWREEIFDCDDFAFSAKAAVAKWGNGYLRANGYAIIFGIMFGRNAKGEAHAYNWYLNADLNGITFFEPQNGNEMANPGYNGYFSVF